MSDERYVIKCYVDTHGEKRYSNIEGAVSADTIYGQHPASCRYAVLETTDGAHVVVDIWKTVRVLTPPVPPFVSLCIVGRFDDVDAAIMAAVLRRDDP